MYSSKIFFIVNILKEHIVVYTHWQIKLKLSYSTWRTYIHTYIFFNLKETNKILKKENKEKKKQLLISFGFFGWKKCLNFSIKNKTNKLSIITTKIFVKRKVYDQKDNNVIIILLLFSFLYCYKYVYIHTRMCEGCSFRKDKHTRNGKVSLLNKSSCQQTKNFFKM